MAQNFGNPYQPATAIGSGLKDIAIGLFGGKRGGSTRNASLDAAHAALYDEQTRAKAVERQLNERLLADQGGDAQDELIAAHVGLPTPSVKAFRRELQTGGPNLHEYEPYADKLSDAMIAIRGGYADKSINPANISKALLELKERRDRDAIIAGGSPTNTSRAYLATGGKPLFGALPGAAGSQDLSSGVTALNEIGTAKVGTETAHQGAYRGQERASNAAAGASSALARQRNLESDAGVRLGAPVLVPAPDDSGAAVYASPLKAVTEGRRTVARPSSAQGPVRAVLNADGTTTWERVEPGTGQQVGAPPRAPVWRPVVKDGVTTWEKLVDGGQVVGGPPQRPAAPRAPRKVGPNDRKMIETSIGEAMTAMEIDPQDLDPATRKAIIEQAEIEFAGGASGHQGAVSDAINKVAPEGFEPTGIYGFRTQRAKGGPRAVEKPVPGSDKRAAAPAPAPAPATATAGTAAPAPAKVTRPKGLTDGQLIEAANAEVANGKKDPAQVKAQLKAWGVKFSDKPQEPQEQ